ncbi:hypothetical protein XANCAGTX0491_005313 [Xanthoria calcicola]
MQNRPNGRRSLASNDTYSTFLTAPSEGQSAGSISLAPWFFVGWSQNFCSSAFPPFLPSDHSTDNEVALHIHIQSIQLYFPPFNIVDHHAPGNRCAVNPNWGACASLACPPVLAQPNEFQSIIDDIKDFDCPKSSSPA